MKEILPGLHSWSARHERIGFDVWSYYVATARALIDPMEPPDGGLDAFSGMPEPEVILLTTRHHYRHSDRFIERFGCRVLCHESGLHEFTKGEKVEGFAIGDELAPGVVALEMNSISDDDTVLRLADHGALSFADAVIHWGGAKLGFVPDSYMGDDPEGVKRGVRAACQHLLTEEQFDALLFAHGEPIPAGGRDALRAFLESE